MPASGVRSHSRATSSGIIAVASFVLDFDAEGNVVGIDIQEASRKLDLNTLERA